MAQFNTPYTGQPMTMASSGNIPILTCFRQRRSEALSYYQPFFSKIAGRYDLYRGFYRANHTQGRNAVHLPMLFTIIQNDVALKVPISFGQDPIVEFLGYDAKLGRKLSQLVTKQSEDNNSFLKAIDFYLSADMYGTGIARDGWKTVRRKMQWRENEAPPTIGNPKEVIKTDMVTTFDGPIWDNIDILDFWPQPGRPWLNCMWAMVRYYLDFSELEFYSSLGLYDGAGIALLKQAGMPSSTEQSYMQRYNVYRSASDYDVRRNERFAKPVELVDMVGYVPDECAPDGINWRIVTIANDQIVIRNRPFPFWHGELPFHVYCPQRDPHYLHGIGKIEVGEKMQYLMNRVASQKADANDFKLDPWFIVNRLSGIDEQNIYSKSGRVLGVDGPVDDTQIREMSPDTKGFEMANQDIQNYWGLMQLALGMSQDAMLGMPGPAREAAASFVGRRESGMSRQQLEAFEADLGFVQPLCNRMHKLNRQFLKTPHEMKVLGPAAQIDEQSGLPVPPEPMVISLDELNQDYSARAVGATRVLGKSTQQQNLMLLLQTLQTNPVAVQAINWVSFLRYTLKVFDVKNIDELLVQQAVPAINQTAQDQGVSPQDAITQIAGMTQGGDLSGLLTNEHAVGQLIGG